MTFAEVTTVALVKYHHHFLVTHTLQPFVIVFTGDCHIQFLNRSNDNLAVAAQSLDKFLGVVRIVNSTWLEGFIFRLCLGIEVVAVNDKHHLIDTVDLADKLSRLERGECLSCSCRMPDVTVLVGVLNSVEYLLHGIELIGTKHHKAFVALMQHNVLTDHLSQVALVEEETGELTQIVERHVSRIRPVERELIAAVRVVGKVTCIHAVADDEELDVVEESVKRSFVVSLNLIVCLFQFHTTLLQLYLYQWQTIDEDGHIVAALLASFNGYLV